jgi:hypothetical protein
MTAGLQALRPIMTARTCGANMANDPLTPEQLELMADAMAVAAASMTTLAVSQVVIASSSALSAALLAAPVHQANVHTTELATTAKAVDRILNDPPPPEIKKAVVVKANPGAPVVT